MQGSCGRDDAPGVVVASDVRLYIEGLALVFAADGRLRVSSVVETAETAVEYIAGDHSARALLIDASMPGCRDVLDAARHLTARVPVVIFGVPELDDDLLFFIEAGVAAFVSRDATSHELIEAVLSAMRGESILSPRHVANVLMRLANRARFGARPAAGPPLTDRECELASLLDEGLSNKEIAQRLHISVATVKNHVHRILEKLQVERRGQAASRFRQSVNPRI
jgi:DNA-binding NarL/FixJ family response regulator